MITSRIARHRYRSALDQLERGDLDAVLSGFHERCRLRFVGDTSLGADLSTPAGIRRWFERFDRLLPDRRFTIERSVVSGPPWDIHLAAHVTIRSSIDGEPYENQFAHFLRLTFGKVIEDLILEDTQRWDRGARQLAATGVTEATAAPIADHA